jgi:AraC family transcriptional regulator of adaptative response/methylated-DNA-[protein]-cysteine methyltransferase
MILREGKPVIRAVYDVGYDSRSWLYSNSKVKLGMTPSTYRNSGKDMLIKYRIVDSPLGKLLVARTKHGVCYIGLWNREVELEEALRKEYQFAEMIRENGKLDTWTNEVLDYLSGRVRYLGDIPTDIAGTGFQVRVWKALQAIPWGSTRTYDDIAKSIGHPTAARAVGKACATNPISLLIPCHRLIGKNGELHGYRWGLERKKMLLEIEKSEY